MEDNIKVVAIYEMEKMVNGETQSREIIELYNENQIEKYLSIRIPKADNLSDWLSHFLRYNFQNFRSGININDLNEGLSSPFYAYEYEPSTGRYFHFGAFNTDEYDKTIRHGTLKILYAIDSLASPRSLLDDFEDDMFMCDESNEYQVFSIDKTLKELFDLHLNKPCKLYNDVAREIYKIMDKTPRSIESDDKCKMLYYNKKLLTETDVRKFIHIYKYNSIKSK